MLSPRESRREEVGKFAGVFMTDRLVRLKPFKHSKDSMGIVNREIPEGADEFFEKLMTETPFAEISGIVRKAYAREDILFIFEPLEISLELQSSSFFMKWVTDMAEVCKTFCDVLGTESISFWLGMERGCARYHVDNVPFRMLVTYAGKGTEWLPDEAADRTAFYNLEPNDKIVKDKSAIQFLNEWDVSVFRGGREGVVHRTPDAAVDGSSILMRLDHPSFLKLIEEDEESCEP